MIAAGCVKSLLDKNPQNVFSRVCRHLACKGQQIRKVCDQNRVTQMCHILLNSYHYKTEHPTTQSISLH